MNKKIIILIISILVLGGVSIFFIWNNIEQNSDPHIAILNEKYSEGQMNKFMLSYLKDYKIEDKEGIIQVTLKAPDFAYFAENIDEKDIGVKSVDELKQLSKEETEKLILNNIKKVIKKDGIKMKDYTLTVENTNQETIEKAFLDKMAYDIAIVAIKDAIKDMNFEN